MAQALLRLLHAFGLLDFVADKDRRFAMQPQQIPCGNRTHNGVSIVDDAEMADAQSAHARDREIGEGIHRNRHQRPAHQSAHLQIESLRLVNGACAQEIALGHDARVVGMRRIAIDGDKHGRDCLSSMCESVSPSDRSGRTNRGGELMTSATRCL